MAAMCVGVLTVPVEYVLLLPLVWLLEVKVLKGKHYTVNRLVLGEIVLD